MPSIMPNISKPNVAMPTLPRWLIGSSPQQHTMTFDRGYVVLAIIMYAIGLIMVASSSMPLGIDHHNDPFYFIFRHGFYIVVSLVVAAGSLLIPMQKWHENSFKALFIAAALLVAVLLIGRSVNGSTRWISLGPINIQAAEPAKLFFFCYLSGYLVRKQKEVTERAKGWFKPLCILVSLAVLLLFQPDMGTIVVMFVTTMGVLFLAGAKLWHFISLFFAGVGLGTLLVVFEPYRWRRVTSFMDPWGDPFNSGYQLTQSLMAYGRGEFLGQGLGNSIQKLEYLPEAHTDFVMAVIGEEFGFLGVLCILALCLTLVIKALLLGKRALENEKYFEGYFAFSIGIWISFQAAVNVGASSGMFPTKGLTMPLISYGGSSMVIMTLAIVVLIRIDHELRMQSIQAVAKGDRDG